jgi:hypothetical protein
MLVSLNFNKDTSSTFLWQTEFTTPMMSYSTNMSTRAPLTDTINFQGAQPTTSATSKAEHFPPRFLPSTTCDKLGLPRTSYNEDMPDPQQEGWVHFPIPTHEILATTELPHTQAQTLSPISSHKTITTSVFLIFT